MSRAYLASELDRVPFLAMDAMPSPKFPNAALASARGGEGASADQDPNDGNTTIADSPQQAAFMRLSQFLSDRLGPDDVAEALQMLQQMLGDNPDAGAGNGGNGTPALAGDRRPGAPPSYAQRFPHSGRLGRSRATFA